MEIKLLETAGWYIVFKNLRQSYSLDSRSGLQYEFFNFDKAIVVEDIDNNKFFALTSSTKLQLNIKDLQLLSTLVKRGDSHSKIIRGLQTYVEITAPRYWWHEWLTYVMGVLEINPTIDWVSLNSESTMHTLLKEDGDENHFHVLTRTQLIEDFQDCIIHTKAKKLETIKANLPEGYLQTRTFQVSYQAWRRIYQQRHDHKLEEWSVDIVKFIKSLPFAKELITINID